MKLKGGGDKERTVGVYVVSYSAYAYEGAIFCTFDFTPVLNTSVLPSLIRQQDLGLLFQYISCAADLVQPSFL
jgi:hypothetical protein